MYTFRPTLGVRDGLQSVESSMFVCVHIVCVDPPWPLLVTYCTLPVGWFLKQSWKSSPLMSEILISTATDQSFAKILLLSSSIHLYRSTTEITYSFETATWTRTLRYILRSPGGLQWRNNPLPGDTVRSFPRMTVSTPYRNTKQPIYTIPLGNTMHAPYK